MNTKDDIIKEITDYIQRAKEFSKKDMVHSSAFYQTFINVAEQFVEDVKKTILPKKLEADWAYNIGLDYNGFQLLLQHWDNRLNDDNEPESTVDQTFTLITTAAPYLNTGQYAKAYGIEEVTVRAWIRRGKLRAAERYGNEWRIPVLLDYPRQRGYQPASYSWSVMLSGLPEDMEFLNDYRSISIVQDKDRTKYNVSLYSENAFEPSKQMILNLQERERMELVLISNKDIRYDARLDEGIIADIMYGSEID